LNTSLEFFLRLPKLSSSSSDVKGASWKALGLGSGLGMAPDMTGDAVRELVLELG